MPGRDRVRQLPSAVVSFHPLISLPSDVMSLFSLIAAFLLEQLRPLSSRLYLERGLAAYADYFQRHFNAGERWHGKTAWFLAVLPPVLLVLLVYGLLYRVHPLLGWVLNVALLYLTMGFRQFSHYFTDIHKALRADRLEEARTLLSRWWQQPAQALNPEEVARVSIEQALLASYRHVFGVVIFFVLFSMLGLCGGAGAVLFRLVQFLRLRWRDTVQAGSFAEFSGAAGRWLDWLPVRMTAATFAIVGDFEDTIYCWRSQAASWPDSEAGILLASGAGALGVRLGMLLPQDGLPLDRPELGIDNEADADFMQSTVGLMWRAIVFWLILLVLLSVANLLG